MHADQDEPRHYQLCRGILAEQTSPADLAMFWQVGRYIAQSEADMYTAWDREMRTNRT
jgi:pyrroloquinoline-quinone synthase